MSIQQVEFFHTFPLAREGVIVVRYVRLGGEEFVRHRHSEFEEKGTDFR